MRCSGWDDYRKLNAVHNSKLSSAIVIGQLANPIVGRRLGCGLMSAQSATCAASGGDFRFGPDSGICQRQRLNAATLTSRDDVNEQCRQPQLHLYVVRHIRSCASDDVIPRRR
jgi:hypothetical protein